MRVVLLRNLHETSNLSMKLYADRLARAVDGRCEFEHVHPWAPLDGRRQWPRLLSKGLDYAARYAVYPMSASRRRGDVFHIVDHAYAHLLMGLPVDRAVVTCHDVMLLKLAAGEFGGGHPRPAVASMALRFSLRFLRRAAMVVAVSRATAHDLVKYLRLSPERIRVIYHGVDPEFNGPPDPNARRAARSRFGLDNRPVLLHVGNNWFYKNVEGTLRALAILRSTNGGRRPVLVKAGERLSANQRQLARELGVADQVLEVGRVMEEELRRLYWSADVVVCPSWWEGFGWPPLEAMASGTPVVCSDRGALREIVGDAALIVKPEDPADIAEGIRRVLDDADLRNSMTASGLDRARKFTWERAAEEIYQVYREVAGAAR